MRPLLAAPIQCEDDPTFMAFGTKDRPGRLGISVRDFARFGLLYLRKGNWQGEQIISEKHAVMAVTSPLPNSIPRAGNKPAEMIPGQRTCGSRRVPDNQCDHIGSYSWLWWINGVDREGKRHWEGVPVDAYGAFGHGGPRAMIVIPSLDLILSWNDSSVRSREMETRALKLLVEAVE
jgi:CubicO group peptidase (beta-lactamase class C family)